MNKVGILTFHNALNYGAVLQSYALQRFISSQEGFKAEIINYQPADTVPFASQKYNFSNPAKQLIANLIRAYYYRSMRLRDNRFFDFAKNYHNLSEKTYTSLTDFQDGLGEYNVLVSGSDQVFNPKKDSQIYYLGFDTPNAKKVAYAPSLGITKIPEYLESQIKEWLSDFYALSCRETEGAAEISRLTERNIPIVCDPVCLLSAKQWREIAIPPKDKDYIFLYDLNGGENLFRLAKSLSKQTGLPIVYSALNAIHPYIKNCIQHHDLGPKEWLGYISKASYVVTDSFHGTMLSMILGTRVITKIAIKSTSSRITSIMDRLGVQKQLIDDINDFDINKIQFNEYQQKLNAFVSESKKYLISAIQTAIK